jgi:DNA polymerase III delta prime subunit
VQHFQDLSDSDNALSILRNKEVNEAKDALLAINPMLEKYGVLKEKLTLENINSNLVTQSLEANSEIQKILSAGGGERRGAVNVLYSLKEADGDKVEAALREFGFDVHGIEPLNEQRTNAIFFGSRVNKEDVKLVAYVLIRAGVEIQGIFRTTSARPISRHDRTLAIQVIGSTDVADRPL